MKKLFDVNAAIAQAWNQIWEEKKSLRDSPSSYRSSEGFYITRMELIRKVRYYAFADQRGMDRTKCTSDYGVRFNFNLDGKVCDWLSNAERGRKIEGHAFGRHTITGRRYRPFGAPLAPVEEKTMADKVKRASHPRPVHFNGLKPNGYTWRPACSKPTRTLWNRSKARVTSDHSRVTCPRCLKLLPAAAFNLAFHEHMLSLGATHERFANSFEDIGDAENGPELTGCPGHDVYELDGIEYVVFEDGSTDRGSAAPPMTEPYGA